MAKTRASSPADDPVARRRVRPRAPARVASRARYETLVDAVDALLQAENPERVGLYQIAEQAGVPPASVYHFFPTKEAAFLALTQRHLAAFAQLAEEPIPLEHLASWQTLTAWDLRRGVAYYNAHPSAAKLFLGGFGGLETRQADREYVEAAAEAAYRRMDRLFHMPFLRDRHAKFLIHLRIIDAVLSVAYVRAGQVTEEFFQEALAAGVAYGRTFLPERLEWRPEVQAAADRGDAEVSLTKLQEPAA